MKVSFEGRSFDKCYRDWGPEMAYRLGVDIGGTHTDVILYHESNTEMTSTIVPTNPLDVNVGIFTME